MTGPEHYLAAESNLRIALNMREQGDHVMAAHALAEAQVQATLALAAATALNDGDTGLGASDYDEWRASASVTAPEATS